MKKNILSVAGNDRMGVEAQKKSGNGLDRDRRFRLADFLIILLCLFGVVFFVNLFRIDLFRTLDSKNEKQVGTIIIKNNIVQRRMANRVVWDRLVVDSPAYMGDLIRTADISSATLHIESSSLELDERTLIRIQRSRDGDGLIQIDLIDGRNLGLTTGDGSLVLNIMGRRVKAGPETILNATAGKDGMVVQVRKGTAVFIDGEQEREIAAGAMVSLDADGRERMEKAAVAIQPHPNARYLKNGPEPLHINFEWNGVNLDSGEPLRLEIAEDRDFTRIIQVIENLDADTGVVADVDLDAGIWYWRLSSMETGAPGRVISTERFTVTEVAVPSLPSPVMGSLFRYQNDLPKLRFQWSRIEGASSYVLEVSDTPDFISHRISEQTTSVFLLDSSLGQGTWYWRVKPVFPPTYEGNAAFSPAAFFRIEPGSSDELALVLPESAIEQPMSVLEQPKEPVMEQAPAQLAPRQPVPRQPVPVQLAPRQPAPVQTAPRQPEPVQESPSQGTPSVTLLPAPGNLQPPRGYRIGVEELKTQTNIVFSWSAVQGANAYIFTLYEESANGRRQIISRPPENNTSWTLENLSTLGRGVFVWQIEAVNRNSIGVIEQRGGIGESAFTLDVPDPGTVRFEDPGILYGF